MYRDNARKVKYGFTLVELLSVILVLSLIIILVSVVITNVFENVYSKIDDATKNLILDATNEYVLEYRNKDGWKEYVSADGNISFCVSLNSLIDSGYYSHDDEMKNKDEIFIKGIMNSNKVYSYELFNKRNELAEECEYAVNDLNINRTDGKIDILGDDNNDKIGGLDYIVNYNGNNTYDVDINFMAELGIKNIEVDAPVYVAIVLDNSGSMLGDLWDNAKDAAISLSETIINQLDDSHVALIQYNDSPMLVRNFEHKVLTDNMFVDPNGGTNVSGSLDLVASLYNDMDIPDYSLLYTILLYDGAPNYISYLRDITNNSFVYNSSRQLYYDNFLSSFNNSNSSYIYNYKSSSNYNNVLNAAEYLKSNFLYSNLITIGYNFSSGSSQLKKISTNDSNFCDNSGYVENVERTSDEDLLSEQMISQMITYPFVYDEDSDILSSSNTGLRTESYGYFELDLTKFSSSEEIELEFDYMFSQDGNVLYSGVAHDYLRISITDNVNRDISKFSKASCSLYEEGVWSNINNNYIFCDTSTNVTKNIIYGGKKYYVHFYYEQNSSINKMVTINNFSYSVSNNELIYDSSVSGYNYDNLVTLSTEDESRLVYSSVYDNGKLGLSGQSVNSYSGSYKKIDLTDMDGTYLLTVNAKSNYGMGAIYLSNDIVAPYPPAKSQQVSGVSNFNYESYKSDSCNQPNFKCIFANTAATDFNFSLEGGQVYYVHFVNTADKLTQSEANFIINDISLVRINDQSESISIDIDDISSDTCSLDSSSYVSCLMDSGDYEYSFVSNNGSIISSNKEIKNSCSYSYAELDLTSYTNDVIVSFNSTISSEGNNDYGNIIITETSSLPVLKKNTCDLNKDNDCVLVTSGSGSNDVDTKLEGGKKYYVHFMYCKNNSGDSNGDYFSINKININEISSNLDMNISLDLTDTVDYNNYIFKEVDKTLVSTNEGIGGSVSHSYLKVDLSTYDDTERFLFQVDDFASHRDTGIIIMNNSSDMPSYYDSPMSNSENVVVSLNDGNDTEITTNEVIVDGGKVYYLHFIYAKGIKYDYYDDYYKINGVRIYKFVNSDLRKIDLSLDKYVLENYEFVLDGDKYISSNDKIYTSNYSYFEVDLSSYSSDKRFSLNFDINMDKDVSINKIIVSMNKTIPAFYNSTATLYLYSNSEVYSTNLDGGEKYYVHILTSNDNDLNNVTINSISLNEIYIESTNSYCYYDSDEEKIGNVFANLSTRVIDSVPKLTAKSAKIILTTKINDNILFHIKDKDGNVVDVIEKDIELVQDGYTTFELKDNYEFILDNVGDCMEDKCSIDLKLFDIKIELIYDNDETKVIDLDDDLIPVVTVDYYNNQVLN